MNSKAGYRILIVDDEPEYQKVVSLILDGAGYHTDACSNGREAIEFVRDHEVHLVITDLRMPEMDGEELIKELTGYGSYRYAVSERKASLNVASRLRTIFKEGVISFDLAQNIIVLKTMPGVASAACAAIDGMEITGLVGSLAGDDTAMLVMRTNEDAQEFCNEIHTMLK